MAESVTAPDPADSRTGATQMMGIDFDAVAWSDAIIAELTVRDRDERDREQPDRALDRLCRTVRGK
jgi:hypothetical protein